jgi:hypothetical protein
MHRFDGEKIGCHALHSVVAFFESKGLRLERKTISVPTRWGADAHVALYWLAPESYPLAARLLGLNLHVNRDVDPSGRAYLLASTGARG